MNAIFKVRAAIKPHPTALGVGRRSIRSGRRRFCCFEWMFLLGVLLRSTAVSMAAPAVSNIQVRHHPGMLSVEVSYDLAVDDPWEWRVVLGVSTNKGLSYLELDEGVRGNSWPVQTGPGQKLVWYPPASWLGLPANELQFRLKVVVAGPPGMLLIKPGSFSMGSPEREGRRAANEGPVTEVSLSRGYWLGKYEVTQREWELVMGSNPSRFKGNPELPVETISWDEAMEYCRRVTKLERGAGRLLSGYEYRLPTEAEWEYACRAGSETATAFGDRLKAAQANFDPNYPFEGSTKSRFLGKTTKVGSYPANAWGLHDMHGNVWEWCLDWYEGKLPGGAVTNPMVPKIGTNRVIRGGGWNSFESYCRSAFRYRRQPSDRTGSLGFRVACAPVLP